MTATPQQEQEAPYHYNGPKQRHDWLATAEAEPVLEPDLPIIDPHHHMWAHADDRYILDDMLDDVQRGHNVLATVYIQAFTGYRSDGPEHLQPIGETEYAAAIAEACSQRTSKVRLPAAIIGHADLRLGAAVEEVLDAHIAAARGLFRGVRMIAAQDDRIVSRFYKEPPPAGLMADARFREGFAVLRRFGLTYDSYIYHHQLEDLADLARAFPDTGIILDHSGMALGIGPYAGQRAEVFAHWKHGIEKLAALDNVSIKLGGMTLAFWGFGFHEQPCPPSSDTLVQAWRPYVEFCIEKFGPQRCMFESNFPPDKASCGYVSVWNAFKKLAAGASSAEKAWLFHDTAARTYRL